MREYRKMNQSEPMSAPQSVQDMVFMSDCWGVRGAHNFLILVLGFIGQNVLSPLFGLANTKKKM